LLKLNHLRGISLMPIKLVEVAAAVAVVAVMVVVVMMVGMAMTHGKVAEG
jgi:hypothetical protein